MNINKKKRQNMFIALRIYLGVDNRIVGSKGLIELLKAIEEEKSIRAAAIKVGMNYRKAWSKINNAERALNLKLLEKQRGRGGSKLTREAKILIDMYERVLGSTSKLIEKLDVPVKMIS